MQKLRRNPSLRMFSSLADLLLVGGFFVQLLLCQTNGYRIAMTSPELGSHVMGKLVVGKALVERGHEVYLIVTNKYEKVESIRKVGIKPIQYKTPDDAYLMESTDGLQMLADIIFSGANTLNFDAKVSECMHKDCEYLFNDTETIDLIKQLNFDLFIVEPFALSPCNTLVPVYVGKPYISLTLHYIYLELRSPALPSFVTMADVPLIVENLDRYTWTRKLKCIIWNYIGLNLEWLMPGLKLDLIRKYSPESKSWGDILRGSQLFLCELDHHLGGFAPANPNFISIAGMTASKAKPLPEDLEAIMEASGTDGVILVTFGASAYYMPEDTVRKFLTAFSQVNQTVLARFNVPDGVPIPNNVKILSWLPQNDILGHAKTRLFITHCGNSGQYEALYHAVPMLGFPMFAEQADNSIRAADRGYGLAMDVRDFTSEELVRNIRETIYNPKYKSAIQRGSEIWRDENSREAPLDRATFWIEHVIKYGGRHLRSPALELSLFEFLMFDVLLALLLALLLVVVVVVSIVVASVRLCCRRYKCSSGKVKQTEKVKSS